NLLWSEPTGYSATMIGFPYDDLDTWRAVYPPDVFVAQLRKVADGFDQAQDELRVALQVRGSRSEEREALRAEMGIAEAAALHFRSAANQARFITLRNRLTPAAARQEAQTILTEIERILNQEIAL